MILISNLMNFKLLTISINNLKLCRIPFMAIVIFCIPSWRNFYCIFLSENGMKNGLFR